MAQSQIENPKIKLHNFYLVTVHHNQKQYIFESVKHIFEEQALIDFPPEVLQHYRTIPYSYLQKLKNKTPLNFKRKPELMNFFSIDPVQMTFNTYLQKRDELQKLFSPDTKENVDSANQTECSGCEYSGSDSMRED